MHLALLQKKKGGMRHSSPGSHAPAPSRVICLCYVSCVADRVPVALRTRCSHRWLRLSGFNCALCSPNSRWLWVQTFNCARTHSIGLALIGALIEDIEFDFVRWVDQIPSNGCPADPRPWPGCPVRRLRFSLGGVFSNSTTNPSAVRLWFLPVTRSGPFEVMTVSGLANKRGICVWKPSDQNGQDTPSSLERQRRPRDQRKLGGGTEVYIR